MHEAPANMEEKIRLLTQRIQELSTPWYEKALPAQQETLVNLISELEMRMFQYRSYEIPWDSKLIDAVGSVEGIKFKTKAVSTFESVMDKAREIFLYINEPEVCREC